MDANIHELWFEYNNAKNRIQQALGRTANILGEYAEMLVVLLFNKNGKLLWAGELKAENARVISRFYKHTNGYQIWTTSSLFDPAVSRDARPVSCGGAGRGVARGLNMIRDQRGSALGQCSCRGCVGLQAPMGLSG